MHANFKKQKNTIQEKLDQKTRNYNIISEQLQRLQTNNGNKTKEITRLTALVTQLEQEKAKSLKEIADLTGSLGDITQKLKSSNTVSKSVLDDLGSEIESLQKQLDESKISYNESLAAATSKYSDLELQKAELQTKLDKLISNMGKNTTDRIKLDKRITELEELLKTKNNEITNLQSSLTSSSGDKQQIMSDLTGKIKELEGKNKKLDELENRLKDLAAQISQSQDREASLQNKITQMQSLGQTKTSESEGLINQLRQEITKQTKITEQLTTQFQKEIQKATDLESSLSTKQKEINNLIAKSTANKQTISELTSKSLTNQKTITNLTTNSIAKNKQIAELNAALSTATTQTKSAQNALANMKKYSERANITPDELQQLRNSLRDAEQKIVTNDNLVSASQQKLEELKKEAETLKAEKAQIIAERNSSEKELERTLNDLNSLTQISKKNKNTLQSQLNKKNAEIKQITNNAKVEMNKYAATLDEVSKTLEDVTTKYNELMKHSSNLEKETEFLKQTAANIIKKQQSRLNQSVQTENQLDKQQPINEGISPNNNEKALILSGGFNQKVKKFIENLKEQGKSDGHIKAEIAKLPNTQDKADALSYYRNLEINPETRFLSRQIDKLIEENKTTTNNIQKLENARNHLTETMAETLKKRPDLRKQLDYLINARKDMASGTGNYKFFPFKEELVPVYKGPTEGFKSAGLPSELKKENDFGIKMYDFGIFKKQNGKLLRLQPSDQPTSASQSTVRPIPAQSSTSSRATSPPRSARPARTGTYR